MMNSRPIPKRPSGFSLMEVLVAVVILSFGLLALAGLQGVLFKASADVKAQSVGLALASEKLEYFRGYDDTAAYQAIDSGSDTATTIGGITYTRTWTVTRYASPVVNAGTAAFAFPGSNTGALGSAYVTNNEFKRIEVTVSWTDAQNVAQSVTLEDAIAGLDPGDSRKIGKLTSGTTNRGPQVRIFDISQQQQGVIPIGIGTGDANTAATNPKPLVNGSNVIETRFDVLTYSGLSGSGSSATAIEQARVETSLVACSCDYDAAPAASPAVYGKRPTYWNGFRYTEPETSSTIVLAGEDASASGTQSNLCSICCRDHHDPATLGANDPKFDPRDSNHSAGHFLLTGTSLSAQKTTGKYTEACRIIRVGGAYRVAADMYNDYLNLLDTNSLVSTPDAGKAVYVPTAAATLNYQNFVKNYLDDRLAVTGSPTSDTKTNRNVILATDVTSTDALESSNGINSVANSISVQPSITFVKDSADKWLHLRGLFVDYLEDSAIQAIKDAKQNCGGSTQTEREQCVLPVLPFTSLNLTELGNWTPVSGSQIVVANSNFSTTLTTADPIRGKTSQGSNPTEDQVNNALATIRRSNSGLTTLLAGISTEDALSAVPSTWTATQPFTMSGFSGSPGTGGTYTVTLAASPSTYVYQAANVSAQYLNSSVGGTTCNYAAAGDPITCTATSLAAATLTVGKYNYSTSIKSNSLTSPFTPALTCINTATNTSFTHTFNGQGETVSVCKNWQVTGSTNGGSVGAATNEGQISESTPVVFGSTFTNGSAIKFTLVPQTDTLSYTCFYTGSNTNTDHNYTVTATTCP